MNFFSNSKSLGILGGGQLGKMLLYVTRKWDIKTYVLDPNEDCPAKLACNFFFKGDLSDFDTVYKFGKQVEILTNVLESQDIPALVIWGKEDRILPVDHAGSLPNQVQVKILEDGGHMVQMESASEVNQLINEFWEQ